MGRAGFEISLNGEWLFHKGDFDYRRNLSLSEVQAICKSGGALSGYEGFDFSDSWHTVTVPHDALCDEELTLTEDSSGGYKKRISCWYKRSFYVDYTDFDLAELVFDGVLGKCEVYVNGVLVTRNFSGYNRFSCDISHYLIKGENTIAVYVDPRRPEGWWYEGVGIYRQVRIVFKNCTRIIEKDCFVRGRLLDGEWFADADLLIEQPENVNVQAVLKNKCGEIISSAICKAEEKIKISLPANNPELWSPENPELYLFEAKLIKDGDVLDELSLSVGFRSIEWRAERGMLRAVQMRG